MAQTVIRQEGSPLPRQGEPVGLSERKRREANPHGSGVRAGAARAVLQRLLSLSEHVLFRRALQFARATLADIVGVAAYDGRGYPPELTHHQLRRAG